MSHKNVDSGENVEEKSPSPLLLEQYCRHAVKGHFENLGGSVSSISMAFEGQRGIGFLEAHVGICTHQCPAMLHCISSPFEFSYTVNIHTMCMCLSFHAVCLYIFNFVKVLVHHPILPLCVIKGFLKAHPISEYIYFFISSKQSEQRVRFVSAHKKTYLQINE